MPESSAAMMPESSAQSAGHMLQKAITQDIDEREESFRHDEVASHAAVGRESMADLRYWNFLEVVSRDLWSGRRARVVWQDLRLQMSDNEIWPQAMPSSAQQARLASGAMCFSGAYRCDR